MKNTLHRLIDTISNFFSSFCGSSKNITQQIGQYVDEQIDERYENMKTGKPREDRKTRERIKFQAGLVFIICLVIILAIPATYLFSALKGKLVEFSIKSPNEIMLDLGDKAEIYPEVEVISGAYIPDAATTAVGAYWQDGGNGENAILLNDGEFVLSKATEERISTANFLQLQYNSSVRDVIKVYTQDMNLFCMMEDPVLYQESSYTAAKPYITLHAMEGYSQWEIFSFYECRMDEMDMIAKQTGQTMLYDYLTAKSSYQLQDMPEGDVIDSQASAESITEFDGKILVIMATDESDGTSYIIGTKMRN